VTPQPLERIWDKKRKKGTAAYTGQLMRARAQLRPDFFSLHEEGHPERANDEARDHIANLARIYNVRPLDLLEYIESTWETAG
jgi:hypothetical protein